MAVSHDDLLAEAVAAHEAYKRGVEELKAMRREAFARALRGTVTGRELAAGVGLSETRVSRISRGRD